MDLQQLLAVRKQIQDGQPVSTDVLKACIASLREGRTSASTVKAKKSTKSAEPKKSGQQILDDLVGD